MCFGIQNISDFRKIMCCVRSALPNTTSGVWGNVLYSDALLFLQHSIWVHRPTGRKEVCRGSRWKLESRFACSLTPAGDLVFQGCSISLTDGVFVLGGFNEEMYVQC